MLDRKSEELLPRNERESNMVGAQDSYNNFLGSTNSENYMEIIEIILKT